MNWKMLGIEERVHTYGYLVNILRSVLEMASLLVSLGENRIQ